MSASPPKRRDSGHRCMAQNGRRVIFLSEPKRRRRQWSRTFRKTQRARNRRLAGVWQGIQSWDSRLSVTKGLTAITLCWPSPSGILSASEFLEAEGHPRNALPVIIVSRLSGAASTVTATPICPVGRRPRSACVSVKARANIQRSATRFDGFFVLAELQVRNTEEPH